MRKILLLMVAAAVVTVPAALAGNAHFIGAPKISTSGSTATVSGKVAGLGNIPDVRVVAEAEAACENRGNNKPQAANKQTVSAEGITPVQNGKAIFSLGLTATFQPSCSPPMTVQWTLISVKVFDTSSGELLAQYP
ncbi:MAG: hypothetical protein ICV59_00310 [Thermoleophilia bacterium]|nr:hypothetical protein [Thermoleophilia bacterium]